MHRRVSEMTQDEAIFVEAVGQELAASGLPPMAGRMWGWLLVCEPTEQTAAEIAAQLHASRGSISGVARLLVAGGLIRRRTRPGDRREYFSVPSGAVRALLASGFPRIAALRRLMDDGLRLLDGRSAEARSRVSEVREVYAFLEREYPVLLERFVAEQARRGPASLTIAVGEEGVA